MNRDCVCGSRQQFSECCEPLLNEVQPAKTPEQLMRSRYSAYSLGGYGSYLLKTWFAPMAKDLSIEELSRSDTEWLGLKILDSGISGNSGWVEFKAVYRDNQRRVEMHEKSVFTLQGNRWLYVGGEVSPS
ncbi:YchJ family metal-binding protein [Porticoccaceae bacterium]|jgi:SEC-C motif-containing protein|nr:zinc chelation protein SecC [Porticoccaceae bacterium]MDA9574506.1 YchJ family metal-binding protein [Porticoccaceae bacterium]